MIQPFNTRVEFDDGEAMIIYLGSSTRSYQVFQKTYPGCVLEIFVEGSTCIMTVLKERTTLAFTSFNLITLRVAPSGCPLDRFNMNLIRSDIYGVTAHTFM